MNIKAIKPTLIKDIFNNEDYEYIYKIINIALQSENKYEKFIINGNGMKRYVFGEQSKIIKNLQNKISELLNIEIDHSGGFFARYNKDLNGKPALPPHHDNAGDGFFCLTFTAQLDSNTDWPIYVYDDSFQLNKNEAVIFSGNTNIHWRPSKEFSDTDFLDIFVCHFYFKGKDFLLPEENNLEMKMQAKTYEQKYANLISIENEKDQEKIFNGFFDTKIDKVFSDEEIEAIYKVRFDDAINKKMSNGQPYVFSDSSCGYITSVYPLPEFARKKLLDLVNSYVTIKIKEEGIHFPRYTLESGSTPQLKPHYDVGLNHHAFTLSVQLKNTKNWPVYVNDNRYDLGFNQAVIFSGTNQIHWRPDIDFTENDYYDILVCQYTAEKDPLPLSDKHRAKMKEKADQYVQKYFN
jgi:hypothetical protein